MGFTSEWFEQLSTVNGTVLENVIPSRYQPTVEEVIEQTDSLKTSFLNPLHDFVEGLHKRKHQLSFRFRVEDRHVYTYPKNRAFREQLNVGFYSREQAWMRIGVGYRRVQNSDKGGDDLMKFRAALENKGERFDTLIRSFRRPYLEPTSVSFQSPSTSILRCINGDGTARREFPEWLFWGTKLDFFHEEDREILASTSKLVDHVADTFNEIDQSPFGS